MRVAVLFGGRSSEHDISLESARAVLAGLEAGGHDLTPILIDREGRWWRRDPRQGEGDANAQPLSVFPGDGLEGVDVVFPVLHGPFGEDGVVQGLLESLGVPFVGSGVLGSAVCMHKGAFKRMMDQAGLPQVRYEILLSHQWRDDPSRCLANARALGMPQFVKPASLGSSVGISKVTSDDGLEQAIALAFEHDTCAVVEAAARGIEVECSVLGNDHPEISEPGQVIPQGEWYDYESKYSLGGMDLVVPAPISSAQRERVQRIARESFLASYASGLARVDFFVTQEGQVLLNELNTIPGFTETSVFARLFEASGLGYVELLDRLLSLALDRYQLDRSLAY